MDLNVEEYLAGFVGFSLQEQSPLGAIKLPQQGLIELVTLDLRNRYSKKTPAEFGSLPPAKDGDECTEPCNFASLGGILMYLSSYIYITSALKQCARFVLFKDTNSL